MLSISSCIRSLEKHKFVNHYAKRKEVGLVTKWCFVYDFWSHVSECSWILALSQFSVLDWLWNSKVDDINITIIVYTNVIFLDIFVNDSLFMNITESHDCAGKDKLLLLRAQLVKTSVYELGQIHLHQLHHHICMALWNIILVNLLKCMMKFWNEGWFA